MCRIRQLALLLPAVLLVSLASFAQNHTCKQVKVWDTQLPVYPPIARAADMSATALYSSSHGRRKGATDLPGRSQQGRLANARGECSQLSFCQGVWVVRRTPSQTL